MSTSYINQKYTTFSSTNKIVADTTTDFSTPATPKTKATVSYLANGKLVLEQEFIDLPETTHTEYVKFNTSPDSIIPKAPKGHWLHIPNSKSSKSVGASNIEQINTALGETLVGNFSKDNRQQLLAMYEDSKALGFNGKLIKSENRLGKRLLKYEITINSQAVIEINKKAAELLAIPYRNSFSPSNKPIIWIDPETKRIVFVEVHNRDSTLLTIEYTYPGKVDITAPTDSKELTIPDDSSSIFN